MTETSVQDDPSSHSFFVYFDVKNTSSKDYDMADGSSPVDLKFIVTTTDGSKYESTESSGVVKVSAGATVSSLAHPRYSAGKTYQSHTIIATCRL